MSEMDKLNIIMNFRQEGKYSEALKIINELLVPLEENKLIFLIDLLNEKSQCEWRLGELGKAFCSAEKAINLARQSPIYVKGVADALNNHGNIYLNQSLFDDAELNFKKCLELRRKLNDIKALSYTFLNLGNVYNSRGQLEEAEKQYFECYKLLEGTEDQNGLAMVTSNLGNVYLTRGNYEQAIIQYEKSLQLYKGINNISGTTRVMTSLGTAYFNKGDLKNAENKFLDSYNLLKDFDSPYELAFILFNLGSLYQFQGDSNKAINSYNQSLLFWVQINNSQLIERTMINLGNIYYFMGNLSQALTYYDSAIVIAKQLDNKRDIALNMLNIGTIHYYQANLSLAESCFRQSYELLENLGNLDDLCYPLSNLAFVLNDEGNFKESEDFIRKAISIQNQIQNSIKLGDYYYRLISFLLERSEFEAAFLEIENLRAIKKKNSSEILDSLYIFSKSKLKLKQLNLKTSLSLALQAKQLIEKKTFYNYTIELNYHLLQIYLKLFLLTDAAKFKDEINSLILNLNTYINEQGYRKTQYDFFLIKTILESKNTNFEEIKKNFKKILIFAEENGFHHLKHKVDIELNRINQIFSNTFLFESPIPQKVENLHLNEVIAYISDIERKMNIEPIN